MEFPMRSLSSQTYRVRTDATDALARQGRLIARDDSFMILPNSSLGRTYMNRMVFLLNFCKEKYPMVSAEKVRHPGPVFRLQRAGHGFAPAILNEKVAAHESHGFLNDALVKEDCWPGEQARRTALQ